MANRTNWVAWGLVGVLAVLLAAYWGLCLPTAFAIPWLR